MSLQIVTDLYLADDEITPTRCWTAAIVASDSRAPLATSASPTGAARVADEHGASGHRAGRGPVDNALMRVRSS